MAGHNLFLLKHNQMVQPLPSPPAPGVEPSVGISAFVPYRWARESGGYFAEGEGTATRNGVYVPNS